MDFLFIRHFKDDESNTGILVRKIEKIKKIDFTIDFCHINAVSLSSKKNDKKKIEELRDRLFLRDFLPFLPL